MTSGTALVDQELVIHIFAPVDGPHAGRAAQQLRELWDRCRSLLGLTNAIAGLPSALPSDLAVGGLGDATRVVAAAEDPAADYQIIVRQWHQVLNLSLLFAAPVERTDRPVPLAPSWARFARWWAEIAAGGTEAMLGVVRVFQAGSAVEPLAPELTVAVAETLPTLAADPDWWLRGRVANGFTEYDVVSRDARAERAMVMVSRIGDTDRLSAATWSRGEPGFPPLARYLLHAANVRYEARVRGSSGEPDRVRRVVTESVDRWYGRARADRNVVQVQEDLLHVMLVTEDLRDMRRAVAAGTANMTASIATPLPEDVRLASWLDRQLEDDERLLDGCARRLRALLERGEETPATPAGARAPRAPATTAERPAAAGAASSPLEAPIRFGFAVDIVGYSLRPAGGKAEVQRRLADIIQAVLADLGVPADRADAQPAGDGANIFLPPEVASAWALAGLLRTWPRRLNADNARYADRIRTRLAAVVGPVTVTALGLGNDTIVEAARLLDSPPLREAMANHPAASVLGLLSAPLHRFTIAQGYPEFEGHRFESLLVDMKTYREQAWLWLPDS